MTTASDIISVSGFAILSPQPSYIVLQALCPPGLGFARAGLSMLGSASSLGLAEKAEGWMGWQGVYYGGEGRLCLLDEANDMLEGSLIQQAVAQSIVCRDFI